MNDTTKRRLLGQLSSAFFHTGLDDRSKELDSFADRSIKDVVDLLKRLEQTPGLPTPLWKLIVRAKGVVAGKVAYDDFVVESLKYTGLM